MPLPTFLLPLGIACIGGALIQTGLQLRKSQTQSRRRWGLAALIYGGLHVVVGTLHLALLLTL